MRIGRHRSLNTEFKFIAWVLETRNRGNVDVDVILAFVKYERGKYSNIPVRFVQFLIPDESLEAVRCSKFPTLITRMHPYHANVRTGVGYRLYTVLENQDGTCSIIDPTTCTSAVEPIEAIPVNTEE